MPLLSSEKQLEYATNEILECKRQLIEITQSESYLEKNIETMCQVEELNDLININEREIERLTAKIKQKEGVAS